MTNSTFRDGNSGARIAEGLRTAILRGEYPPGTRIRQEDVAARFGASRLPVRVALRMLESDGLVTLIANSGAWVSQLSLKECEEMYQMRERIEPLLLGFSAPELSEETIDRLAALANAMEEEPDIDAFLAIDREFHLLSYSGATTIVLGDTVRKLWNATHHYRRAFALLLDVLEHIPVDFQIDFARTAREALRPEGKLLLTVPNAKARLAGRGLLNDYTHHSSFTEHSLYFVLKNAGFDRLEMDNSKGLGRLSKRLWRRESRNALRKWLIRWWWLQVFKAEIPWEKIDDISFELNLKAIATNR